MLRLGWYMAGTLEYRMKVPVLLKNTTQKSKRYAIFFAVLLDVTHNFGLWYFYSITLIVPHFFKKMNVAAFQCLQSR